MGLAPCFIVFFLTASISSISHLSPILVRLVQRTEAHQMDAFLRSQEVFQFSIFLAPVALPSPLWFCYVLQVYVGVLFVGNEIAVHHDGASLVTPSAFQATGEVEGLSSLIFFETEMSPTVDGVALLPLFECFEAVFFDYHDFLFDL